MILIRFLFILYLKSKDIEFQRLWQYQYIIMFDQIIQSNIIVSIKHN